MQGDDVRVGGVGTLTPAVASHRHEGDAGALGPPPLGILAPRNRQRTEQGRVRRVGDRVTARVDAAQQVAHRGARQLAGAHGPHARRRLRRVVVPVDKGGHLAGEALRLSRGQLGVVVQPRHGLGPLGQRVGDPARVRQHRREPARGDPRVA